MSDRPLFYAGPDPITINIMQTLVQNVRTLQRESVSRSAQADRRRDYDDEFGYPKNDWCAEDYHNLIAYEPIAGIVNSLFPLESWKVSPKVYEKEKASDVTAFEEAWDNLPTMIQSEPSYHAEETGSRIWSTLLNADILSGESRFGVILIGLNDGNDMREPAEPRGNQKITFLRAFPEHLAKITQFESDRTKARYGLPIEYSIQFSDPFDNSQTDINEPSTSRYVHWSRIIHIADTWQNPSASNIMAVPRIKPVRNPILDIRKVRGSSAEMYYLGAFAGHFFGTHPQLGADVDIDVDDIRDMYEQYRNGLQRAMFGTGMKPENLASTVSDPTAQLLAQVQNIAMRLRVPVRKLIGNETGERSTTEDGKQWAGVVDGRNNRYVTSQIIVPLINRLINLKVLPVPKSGYCVEWPSIFSMSDTEKATVLLTRTQAYALYNTSGMEAQIPPIDYMTKFDDMEEERAEAILENAEEAQIEQAEEDQALADEHDLVPEVEGFKEKTPDPIELAKAKASKGKK